MISGSAAPAEAPSNRPARMRASDNKSLARRLDQFYTRPEIAEMCFSLVLKHFNPIKVVMVEPSAGRGAFYNILPAGSIGIDIEPKCDGVQQGDFLTFDIQANKPLVFVGNPPFGNKSRLAVDFFNRAASLGVGIGMILPRTFKKASIENCLNPFFHLVLEVDIPDQAFIFGEKPYSVPTIFQIWEKRSYKRVLRPNATHHPDFKFMPQGKGNFAIRRVGGKAGLIHHDLFACDDTNYFIEGDEQIMRQLDLTGAAKNVAAVFSLARNEIVSLYCDFLAQQKN
ncbi:SAM-dependent methyltransferase [Sphingomonas floccifaciens]|uniref:SAM-dependent methyltransferase n=1 Tax=Sphingomonas floccifaciens TaxID=1844115 RepID=A0ABW4NI29_9SPHN